MIKGLLDHEECYHDSFLRVPAIEELPCIMYCDRCRHYVVQPVPITELIK